jgi:hypothetical protein
MGADDDSIVDDLAGSDGGAVVSHGPDLSTSTALPPSSVGGSSFGSGWESTVQDVIKGIFGGSGGLFSRTPTTYVPPSSDSGMGTVLVVGLGVVLFGGAAYFLLRRKPGDER